MVDFAAATIEWGTTPDTITLLELTKQLLEIVDTSQDTELSMYLQIAGEAAESYIDNKLALQEVTEEFASSFYPVPLRFYPFGTLTSVTIDGDDQTADWSVYFEPGVAWATVSATASSNSDGFNQLAITYTTGYEPLPAQVGFAIAQIAIAYQESAGSPTGAVKKESIVGVGSIEYVTAADTDGSAGAMSPSTIGVLDKYRRMNA